jgi:hypothetical protein
MVSASASAWSGCDQSESMLTTGTSTTLAMRIKVSWSLTRAAMTAW